MGTVSLKDGRGEIAGDIEREFRVGEVAGEEGISNWHFVWICREDATG